MRGESFQAAEGAERAKALKGLLGNPQSPAGELSEACRGPVGGAPGTLGAGPGAKGRGKPRAPVSQESAGRWSRTRLVCRMHGRRGQ